SRGCERGRPPRRSPSRAAGCVPRPDRGRGRSLVQWSSQHLLGDEVDLLPHAAVRAAPVVRDVAPGRAGREPLTSLAGRRVLDVTAPRVWEAGHEESSRAAGAGAGAVGFAYVARPFARFLGSMSARVTSPP